MLTVAVLAWPASALGQGVIGAAASDPADLIAEASEHDGARVLVSGEVIGDRLHADDDHAWLNVLGDDGVGIGVWVPLEQADAIRVFGDYDAVGDTVLVTGRFNQACDQHGGDIDIHAATLRVVETGYAVEREVEPVWAVIGIVGIGLAVVLQRVYRARRLGAPYVSRDDD